MKLDCPEAFDTLENDAIRGIGVTPIPCVVISAGDMSMGGARQVMQNGQHLTVRVRKSRLILPLAFGATIQLEEAGNAIIKQVDSEGDFWVYSVTQHARRGA